MIRGAAPGVPIAMTAPAPGAADVMRLLTAAEAVAAIAADLAVRLEGAAVPGDIAARAAAVAALAAPGLSDAPEPQQRATLGAIRALLRQAGDLVSAPTRPAGWSYDDPTLLDEQGRASRAFGPILAAQLARLGPPPRGHRHVLDVGTGAGHLALGLAEALPDAHVTGIDVWPPALACAHANVARAADIDLATSTFYSDTYNDLPMLARVGTPVAVNPDVRLWRHARAHGWRIEQWR